MGTIFFLLVVYGVSVSVVGLSVLVSLQGSISEKGPIHEEKQALSCICLLLHGQ